MAEREAVEHRDAERLEALLENVLERARASPVGDRAQIAPVALLHLPYDDARDTVELAGLRELQEVPVDVVRRAVRVLEEEDRAVELDLPLRPHRLHEQPEAASDERCSRLAASDRPQPRIVGTRRDRAFAAAA